MDKASWRLRTMRPAALKALRESGSLRQAAKKLGVAHSSLSRAVRRGQLPAPGRVPRPESAVPPAATDGALSFADWARATFHLSRAEQELVRLGQTALDVAQNPEIPTALRLAAMGQFRATLKDLNLPQYEDVNGDIQTSLGSFPRRA